MQGQLEIPGIFNVKPRIKRDAQGCHEWLQDHFGVGREAYPHIQRLFDEFGCVEGFDRAKAITRLDGTHQCDGWSLADVDYIGTFDHSINYHTLLDRAWAIAMQVPREMVPQVWRCEYGGEPRFYDKDGNLLFTSVYLRGGHIVTHEERRAILAGDSI